MRNKWRIPHPATMFFLLMVGVILLSWIFDIYGLSVKHPHTGAEIHVQSLLSPEGVRWFLRHVITNFTGFSPLGMVIVAMFGIGVAEHSGFINACIRKGQRHKNKYTTVATVIFLGLLSNLAGDAGYVILLPIAATLFHSVGLNPIAGIITAYVSVSCGYSVNLSITTLDLLLSRTTQEAVAFAGISSTKVGPLSNYYFMAASTFLILVIIYTLTIKKLIPSFGEYAGDVQFDSYKPLSKRERRAITLSWIIGSIFVLVILWATFSSSGFLRGITGGLISSPFMSGVLFLLSLCAGLMGMIYGFSSGRYRTDKDVIEGLIQPMKLLGTYMVIVFFASQMFAALEYSKLDTCIAIWGANLITSVELSHLGALLLFIFFTAFINLIIGSAISKWAFMAFIFVPMFSNMGIAPEYTQCAFRIGDSSTNGISPFLFYLPLVLTFMQRYESRSTFGTLIKYTWRYSVIILFFWTLLFIIWYLSGLPLGL